MFRQLTQHPRPVVQRGSAPFLGGGQVGVWFDGRVGGDRETARFAGSPLRRAARATSPAFGEGGQAPYSFSVTLSRQAVSGLSHFAAMAWTSAGVMLR